MQDIRHFKPPKLDKMLSPNNNSQLTTLLSVGAPGPLANFDSIDLMNLTGGLNLSTMPSGLDKRAEVMHMSMYGTFAQLKKSTSVAKLPDLKSMKLPFDNEAILPVLASRKRMEDFNEEIYQNNGVAPSPQPGHMGIVSVSKKPFMMKNKY